MKNSLTILCLTMVMLIGSTSLLVLPSTSEAGPISKILKVIFSKSDEVPKKISKATDDLNFGGSKTAEDTVGKTVGEGDASTNQLGSSALKKLYETKNKCSTNQRGICLYQNTHVFAEPKISSRIVTTLDKDEKVCVLKQEGEWAKTSDGWVEKHRISYVSKSQKGVLDMGRITNTPFRNTPSIEEREKLEPPRSAKQVLGM
jgi:hypothetical protein